MKTIAAQEIKRRGMVAVDGWIGQGPVYIVKNNHPRYVVMSESDYESLCEFVLSRASTRQVSRTSIGLSSCSAFRSAR
jgi:PHD/YefM family antitoxin component YafN of YafNO toxin-antitoxin module